VDGLIEVVLVQGEITMVQRVLLMGLERRRNIGWWKN